MRLFTALILLAAAVGFFLTPSSAQFSTGGPWYYPPSSGSGSGSCDSCGTADSAADCDTCTYAAAAGVADSATIADSTHKAPPAEFDATSAVDSVYVDFDIRVKWIAVNDTVIVGPCADDLSLDPFSIGAPISPCGKIYASESVNDEDTVYVNTGWSGGSFFSGHHLILGDNQSGHDDVWSPFLHVGKRGGNLGLGVRNPTRDFEIGTGEITINHQAEATNDLGYDIEILTSEGANGHAGYFDVLYGDSYSGSKELYRHVVRVGSTSPNTSAMSVWYIKNSNPDALTEVMWLDDEGHLVVNGKDSDGSAHPDNRTYSADFIIGNRADSTFEVNGGSEFNGSIAANKHISVQDNVLMGAPTVNGSDMAVAFASGSSPSGATAGSAYIWAESIAAGDMEIWAMDDAGNKSSLTSNVSDYPEDLAADEQHPYVTYHEQKFIGVETYIAMHTMAKLVEQLAHREGLLAADERIIVQRAFTPLDWDAAEERARRASEDRFNEWYDQRMEKVALHDSLNAIGQFEHAASIATTIPPIAEMPMVHKKRSKPTWLKDAEVARTSITRMR